jgi:hypothetical protein
MKGWSKFNSFYCFILMTLFVGVLSSNKQDAFLRNVFVEITAGDVSVWRNINDIASMFNKCNELILFYMFKSLFSSFS